MKQIIIGIHGLGNKPKDSILEYWWLKSIKEGLNNIGKYRRNVPFELVYWADVLHEEPLNLKIENKNDPLYIDEPYVVGRKSSDNLEKPSLTSKILNYIEEQLDKIFLNDDFTINFKNVTDKLIHHYFAELETYYSEKCISRIDKTCSAKSSIHLKLLTVLNKYSNHDILLIAHSMGSIISFDLLSSSSNEISINTFVTIGSPLGIPIIGSKIFSDQKKMNAGLEKPIVPNSIKKQWINLSDKLDKIALDHTLNDDFDSNNLGIKAIDKIVINNYEMDGNHNHHKSYGYLRTPELAAIIDSFLTNTGTDHFYQKYKLFTNKIIGRINSIRKVFKGL